MKSITILLTLLLAACSPTPAVKVPAPAPAAKAEPEQKPLPWAFIVVRVDDDPENPFSVASCDARKCDQPTGYRVATVEAAREIADSLEHRRKHPARVVERIK